MKKILLIAGGIVIVFLAVALFTATDGLSEGANVPLGGIDLSGVSDGSYTGVYDFKRWSNTVVVHVSDNLITGIDIVQDVPGAQLTNCSGEIISRVIETQNTDVDAVTGATVTSKAYLKAIENAFKP